VYVIALRHLLLELFSDADKASSGSRTMKNKVRRCLTEFFKTGLYCLNCLSLAHAVDSEQPLDHLWQNQMLCEELADHLHSAWRLTNPV